jgi:hypothetical protein
MIETLAFSPLWLESFLFLSHWFAEANKKERESIKMHVFISLYTCLYFCINFVHREEK